MEWICEPGVLICPMHKCIYVRYNDVIVKVQGHCCFVHFDMFDVNFTNVFGKKAELQSQLSTFISAQSTFNS